jgi:hypothetical protein
MNKKEFSIQQQIIRETFNDPRVIRCATPESERRVDENVHQGGQIFTTENGEYIDLEFQLSDFTVDELVKYVELAETLYEKHHKKVSIYLLCPKEVNIYVKECEIPSKADFNIKLACVHGDPCEEILNRVKNKLKRGETLNGDDLHEISMLPVMCDEKDRKYYQREYFRIVNRIQY